MNSFDGPNLVARLTFFALYIFIYSFGKVNVLVNNASKQWMCKDFTQIDLDVVESVFRSNILQMFAITKYALPHMKKGDSYVDLPCFLFYGNMDLIH